LTINYSEGRPSLVSQPAYHRIDTTTDKPNGNRRSSVSKSNVLNSSNNSLSHSQLHEEDEGGSANVSVIGNSMAADKISNRSHSRSVTVAD